MHLAPIYCAAITTYQSVSTTGNHTLPTLPFPTGVTHQCSRFNGLAKFCGVSAGNGVHADSGQHARPGRARARRQMRPALAPGCLQERHTSHRPQKLKE